MADNGATILNPREQDELRKERNYGKQGKDLEVKYVATEINGIEVTDKEEVGFGVSNTKVTVPNSNARDIVEVEDPMHVVIADSRIGPQSPKPKATWTRLRRMEIGPVELINEGAKSVLGK